MLLTDYILVQDSDSQVVIQLIIIHKTAATATYELGTTRQVLLNVCVRL